MVSSSPLFINFDYSFIMIINLIWPISPLWTPQCWGWWRCCTLARRGSWRRQRSGGFPTETCRCTWTVIRHVINEMNHLFFTGQKPFKQTNNPNKLSSSSLAWHTWRRAQSWRWSGKCYCIRGGPGRDKHWRRKKLC